MLNILKEHVSAVGYPLDEYKDETKEILKDIFDTYNIVNEVFDENDDESLFFFDMLILMHKICLLDGSVNRKSESGPIGIWEQGPPRKL